jgi:hypothetical protein
MLLSTMRGQATVYFLRDAAQGEWILKKFAAGRAPDTANIVAVQSLVPREAGFEAAFLRRCLRRDSVSPAEFAPPEFVDWIDGTLLMPRIAAPDWSQLIEMMRDGDLDLSTTDRLEVAENLCAKIEILEHAQLAHRDLSVTNVMVDAAHGIHLIDWDSLYAPSLHMPANTITGSDGYTAPFIRERNDDPAATWMVGGDRFALAVLILEGFAAAPGCRMAADGGLLEQSEINARGGPGIDGALKAAARHTMVVAPLFRQALQARTAQECPSPGAWMQALRRSAAARRRVSHHVVSEDFVPLDLTVFVQLDPSRFTPLFR